MKMKKIQTLATFGLVGALCACGGGGESTDRIAHKDEKIYSATIDGVKKDGLTWAESYDAIIAKTKVTSGDVRNEYLHQAEDILMDTGAICPLYYYTDIYMVSPQLSGFYSSPLGYKFFSKSTVGGKGDFDVCVGPKEDSLDPAINSAADGAILINHVFEGLCRWKQPTSGTVATELEPAQCESYNKEAVGNEGHVKYTFNLRSGLKWSDGTALKASDFANSWARAASGVLGADYGYMFDCIVGYDATAGNEEEIVPLSGVVADDANNKLTVEIVSDLPYFLELTAFPTYVPVRLDKATGDDWWTKPASYIGNGPMVFTTIDNENGKTIVAEPNANYWDVAGVSATKVTFHLTDDDSNQIANYNKGDWVFIDSVPNEQIESLSANAATNGYHVTGQLGTYYVIFNVNDPTFNDVLKNETQVAKFRKALSKFIDRNYICEEIGQAGQEPANTFVGKGIMENHDQGAPTEWTTKSGPNRDGSGYFKVDKASFASECQKGIEEIKELGYHYDEKTGKFTDIPTCTYLYNTSTGHKAIAEYLQQALGAYGINLRLESQEWAVFLNTRKDGNYSIARNGWLADYNDACSFLDMWTTGSGNNDAQFGR